MVDTVLKVGSSHSQSVDKFKDIDNLTRCQPGWCDSEHAGERGSAIAVKECIAHLVCEVKKVEDGWDDHHHIILAQAKVGYVRPSHWTGTQLGPMENQADSGPQDASQQLLSFLGSRKFVTMSPLT